MSFANRRTIFSQTKKREKRRKRSRKEKEKKKIFALRERQH
jgi:hypothetical protein